MMTINLGTNSIDVLDGKRKYNLHWAEVVLPVKRYLYQESSPPPIDFYYSYLLKQSYEPDAILRELIDVYLRFRFFHVGYFRNVPMVIGFIGSRGSGKSCGAVQVAVMDYLVRGLPVWSNVDISVKVCYKGVSKTFNSLPVESLDLINMNKQREGLVLIDEVNMTAAEGTRHMAAANLAFSYAMQQVRKRAISVIWTCQGWGWIDNRLRWQTDFVVHCSDAFLRNKYGASCPGDRSVWQVFDLSGMTGEYSVEHEERNRFITDYKVWEGCAWNRPFWKAYDSFQMQGDTDYIGEYKESKKKAASISSIEFNATQNRPIDLFIERLEGEGINKIYSADLWKQNNIEDDKASQMIIGTRLQERGFNRHRDSRGYYYEKILA